MITKIKLWVSRFVILNIFYFMSNNSFFFHFKITLKECEHRILIIT